MHCTQMLRSSSATRTVFRTMHPLDRLRRHHTFMAVGILPLR